MSDAVAAGCALSRSQSVSVVPMIQCRPHGMTNSTLFSVRRMSAASEWMRSFGTTRCTPLDARTWNCPRAATIACVSSVHTPVALITCRALTSMSRSLSRSRTSAPVTRSPSRRNPMTRVRVAISAPKCAAVRAMFIVCRASSTWPS